MPSLLAFLSRFHFYNFSALSAQTNIIVKHNGIHNFQITKFDPQNSVNQITALHFTTDRNSVTQQLLGLQRIDSIESNSFFSVESPVTS